MDDFYFRTVLSLLMAKDLTLISVWNPTYLILLLNYIQEHKKALLAQMPEKRQHEIVQALEKRLYTSVWKKLCVVSCWCDVNAAPYAEKLKVLFPGVTIQPKGLLATEGFVSFPFDGEGCGLSLYSHYFEFRCLSDERFYPVNKLTHGERYEVILTTGGGLYRYRIGDVIEVTGHRGDVPLFRFAGRCGKVSDMFGEKLNEQFVSGVLKKHAEGAEFYMAAPAGNLYVLYIKADKPPDAQVIDKLFCQNFHYDYCRRLGQLKPLRVFLLTGSPEQEYINHCVAGGQRLGNIKCPALSLKGGWEKVFSGHFID